jgi:CBS domain containing-hemolysin-like protein
MHKVLGPVLSFGDSQYLILLLETVISTIIILFLAEYIPKAIFQSHADQMLRVFAFPAYLIYFILFLPVSLMISLSELIIKYVFRVDLPDYKPVFGRIELDNFLRERLTVQQEEEHNVEPELEILKNALEFSSRKAREFMIPRTEITSLDVNSEIEELEQLFIKSGYSKILIFKENIDEVIGYVHAFELFRKPDNIRSVLRPVLFIPESMKANEILNNFTREQRNVAIVIDEFGGTAGMITLEDVVEELFGEIDDEHDTDDFVERKISENEYIFSARLEVDYLNDEYNLELPESDNYTTLSGLIFEAHESIPQKGDLIDLDKFQFIIRKVSNNRIEEVLLIIKH